MKISIARALLGASLVSMAMAAPACDPNWDREYPTHSTTLASFPIRASLSGDIGRVSGISIDDADVTLTGTAALTTVRIDAEDARAGKWAMARFTVRGGLDQPAIAPGAHFTYGINTSSTGSLGVIASPLGCSGPSRNHYTFDAAPRQVEMAVEQGSTPTALRLVFTATFAPAASGPQTVTGSFEYEPR